MHENYVEIKAKNHYDLGRQMGELFAKQTNQSLNEQEDWGNKIDFTRTLHDYSREYFFEYMSEIQGYADAAQITFEDYFALILEDDAIETENNFARCTTLISQNGLILGHNEDASDSEQADQVVVLKKILPEITTLELYYYNTIGGGSVGVNSYGFATSVNTLINSPKKEKGISKAIIGRKFLDTQSPIMDYRRIINLNRLSGFNHNITTVNGGIINIEFDAFVPTISSKDECFVHTNHYVNETVDTATEICGTQTRFNFAQANIKKELEAVDLQKLLMDSSLGDDKSLLNERTVGSMVVDLKNRIAYVRLKREEGAGWVGYELGLLNA